MPHRHAISDADWDRIKDLLPGRPGQTGWLAKDNRLFIDAVLWIAKTGAPWRDLPERFGNWNSVVAALRPLVPEGHLAAGVRGPAGPRPGVADPRLDRHPRPPLRRRRRKKSDGTGGQDEQALGRSRGGFGTKIHVAVNGLGLPVRLVLTPGQAADVTQAETLIEGVPFEVVIARQGLRQPGGGRGGRGRGRRGGDPDPEEPEGAAGISTGSGTRIGTWWSAFGPR